MCGTETCSEEHVSNRKESHPQIRFSLSYRHVRHFIDKTLLWGNTDVMITVVSFFIHDFDNERCRQKLWMMLLMSLGVDIDERHNTYLDWTREDESICQSWECHILYGTFYASTELVLKGSDNLQLCRVNKEVSCSTVNNVYNSLLISMSSDFLPRDLH